MTVNDSEMYVRWKYEAWSILGQYVIYRDNIVLYLFAQNHIDILHVNNEI